jgi:hypothetical protein
MNDPKDLIDGLFNSMIGDEPKADQPETAECHNCADTFLAGTANEDGWCEECVTAWCEAYSGVAGAPDTVGAPILKAVAPDMRYGTAEDEVARDEKANRAAMEKLLAAAPLSAADPAPPEPTTFSQGDEFEVPMVTPASIAIEHLEDLADCHEARFDELERKSEKLLQRVDALEGRIASLLSAFADAIHTAR